MSGSGNPAVADHVEAHRYELAVDGGVAVLVYERKPGAIALVHTEVPPALRGRGLADRLAHHALEAARAAGERVIPVCPFVRGYLERHPEYRSLVREREERS